MIHMMMKNTRLYNNARIHPSWRILTRVCVCHHRENSLDVNSQAFATLLDQKDTLSAFRSRFWIPKIKNLPGCKIVQRGGDNSCGRRWGGWAFWFYSTPFYSNSHFYHVALFRRSSERWRVCVSLWQLSWYGMLWNPIILTQRSDRAREWEHMNVEKITKYHGVCFSYRITAQRYSAPCQWGTGQMGTEVKRAHKIRCITTCRKIGSHIEYNT